MFEVDEKQNESREVEVWDLPIRVFHWLLPVLLALGWATAEGDGVVFVVHKFAGYTLLAALLFRLVWGVVGSRHARFADFVRPWPVVRGNAASLLRLSPQRHIGHNPLGGWMVLLLLAVLFLVAATGLFAVGEDGSGAFARDLPRWAAEALAGFHEALFDFLLVLSAIHVAGVVLDSLLTGDNLVRAMWRGRKRLPERQAREEEPPVSTLWAAAVAAVAMAMVWLALY